MIKIGDKVKSNLREFIVKDIKTENGITYYLDDYVFIPEHDLVLDKEIKPTIVKKYGSKAITKKIFNTGGVGRTADN